MLTYRALVRFFSGVPSHMNNKHILGFEWFFLSGALFPSTNKTFLVCMNVIIVDVFHKIVLEVKDKRLFSKLLQ